MTLRIERLTLPVFDLNGVDDILQLGSEVNRLRNELSLPRMLELTKTDNADVIKFKVWDPRFPDRPGTMGGIAQNQIASEYSIALSEINLPVVKDYLQRSIRYVKRTLSSTIEPKGTFGVGPKEDQAEKRRTTPEFRDRVTNADSPTATPSNIDAAYMAAGELAATMLQISLFQYRQITMLVTYPETGNAEQNQELKVRAIAQFRKELDDSSDSLRELQRTLERQRSEFLPAFAPLSGLLEFARKDLSELPPVALLGTSNVDVRAPMNRLAFSMAHWAKQMQHCLRFGDACNPHHAENVRCIQHAKSCPYDEEKHARLQQRIADEKSRVMQAYVPFLHFKGMTQSATEPNLGKASYTAEYVTLPPKLATDETTSEVVNPAGDKGIPNAPPAFDGSADWIMSGDFARLLNMTSKQVSEVRKAAKHNATDSHGRWGVDAIGTFRRNVQSRLAAYYVPELTPLYKNRYSHAKKA
ncbi:hypothetical protein [Aporhodopirellula rubra]|nr:hypothetical protein [Aporhodopirellula rubra]